MIPSAQVKPSRRSMASEKPPAARIRTAAGYVTAYIYESSALRALVFAGRWAQRGGEAATPRPSPPAIRLDSLTRRQRFEHRSEAGQVSPGHSSRVGRRQGPEERLAEAGERGLIVAGRLQVAPLERVVPEVVQLFDAPDVQEIMAVVLHEGHREFPLSWPAAAAGIEHHGNVDFRECGGVAGRDADRRQGRRRGRPEVRERVAGEG